MASYHNASATVRMGLLSSETSFILQLKENKRKRTDNQMENKQDPQRKTDRKTWSYEIFDK